MWAESDDPAVAFPGDGDRDRPGAWPAPARRLGGDHRRLRRRASRPPGPARRAADPGPRPPAWRPWSSPSTATRPRWCGPDSAPQPALRPRPEARAAGVDRGGPHPGRHFRRGAGQRDGRGLRERHPGRALCTPGWWWWARTSTSATAARGTSPCCRRWGRRPGSWSTGSPSTADRAGRRPAGSPSPRPASGGSGRRPGRGGRRPPRTAPPGPRNGGGAATGAAAPSSGSRRPMSTSPTPSAFPEPVPMPAGTSGRMAAGTWPPSRSGDGPPSTGVDGPLLVEAHLLDFDGDLYGEEARVAVRRPPARRHRLRQCGRSGRPDGSRRRAHPATLAASPLTDAATGRLTPLGRRDRTEELGPQLALEHLAGGVAGQGLSHGTRSGWAR